MKKLEFKNRVSPNSILKIYLYLFEELGYNIDDYKKLCVKESILCSFEFNKNIFKNFDYKQSYEYENIKSSQEILDSLITFNPDDAPEPFTPNYSEKYNNYIEKYNILNQFEIEMEYNNMLKKNIPSPINFIKINHINEFRSLLMLFQSKRLFKNFKESYLAQIMTENFQTQSDLINNHEFNINNKYETNRNYFRKFRLAKNKTITYQNFDFNFIKLSKIISFL